MTGTGFHCTAALDPVSGHQKRSLRHFNDCVWRVRLHIFDPDLVASSYLGVSGLFVCLDYASTYHTVQNFSNTDSSYA